MNDQRQLALRRSWPILAFSGLTTLIIAWVAWQTAQGVWSRQRTVSDFNSLAQVCAGQGLSGVREYVAGPGPHLVVAFRQVGTGWVEDLTVVPQNWQAQSPAGAELIYCLAEPTPLTLPACAAGGPEKGYGQAVAVRLLTASHASLVASDTIVSAGVIFDCWDEQERRLPPAGNIAPEQFQSWLQPYVDIP